MTSGTVCFTVTGEFLTEHHRGLCLEGNWQGAVKDMKDSLIGITLDLVVDVLCGKSKIIGCSGDDSIALVEDGNCSDYLEQLESIYGQSYEENGSYWEPYAVVTNYGYKDLPLGYTRDQGEVEVFTKWMHNNKRNNIENYKWRARFYMDDPHTDRMFVLPVKIFHGDNNEDSSIVPMVVLFKRAPNPPLWYKAKKTPAEAWEATTHSRIYNRGHVETFGDDDTEEVAKREAIRAQCIDYADNASERALQNQMPPSELYTDQETPSLEQMAAHQARLREEMGIEGVDEMNDRLLRNLDAPKTPTVEEYIKNQKLSDAALDDLDSIKAKIVEQCGGKFRTHVFPDPIGSVDIPEQPLLCWALLRTHGRKAAPAWDLVCPQGMKMGVDNRHHSDWMIGAGISLEHYNADYFLLAQTKLMQDIQEEYLGFDVTVLVDSGNVVGEVIHPKSTDTIPEGSIIVIPNASAKYYEVAKQSCDNGGGVIVENGGVMAHLSVVGIEEQFTIVRTPNARKIYPVGTLIEINTTTGKIEMMASL